MGKWHLIKKNYLPYLHIYYQTIIYETRHKTTTTTIHHHKTRSRYIQASGLDLYDILRRPTSPTTYLPEPNSICYLPRDITASKREPGLSRDRNHWNIFAKPEIYKNLPLIPINFFFFLTFDLPSNSAFRIWNSRI